ncbi:helix-turn-helix transcriptional regulator [Kibdelosporangium philippinense]|uniref:Helix-turn-helix transcriptional regulator n=3 Tax=Kibdelosporangium philippinense TaxID=211113 RepID=A0ABS8ZAP4_9PSEU|nr:helix-turn-helix transcriptional regulator [Kibdelosporangium philippinense]
MREASGHTLDTAAAALDKTRSALHRIETGETKANVHLIRTMMDLYDHFDPALIDAVRKSTQKPWFAAYGVQDNGGYLGVETEASHVDEFSAQVIPGLLQTDGYIRALFTTRGNTNLEQAALIRLFRQRRLISESDPLTYTAIVDEAALLRQVGGPSAMREQLHHLLEVANLPTVTLRVLPLDLGAHDALPGPFCLLSFPDPEDPEYLYVEHVTGTLHCEEEEDVTEARTVFTQLESVALDPDDSVALIRALTGSMITG